MNVFNLYANMCIFYLKFSINCMDNEIFFTLYGLKYSLTYMIFDYNRK
jgi:hypothetical protein